MIYLIKILYKLLLFTPKGIISVIQSVCNSGVNLMTLLDLARRINANKSAVNDNNEIISYIELYKRSLDLAVTLSNIKSIHEKSKVIVVSRNRITLLSILFGLSRIGAKVYLINVDISKYQLLDFINQHQIKNIIYDKEFDYLIEKDDQPTFCSSIEEIEKQINKNSKTNLKPSFFFKVIVLTGGTGGKLKVTERKSSAFDFINPLCTLVKELKLFNYTKVYVATPVYHGYGLASICISLLVGAKIYLRPQFNTHESALLINKEKIEIMIVVPLMLDRILRYDKYLTSLKCIISGGATLSPSLIDKVIGRLGNDILFNLYGTTEVGFCILATPRDLLYSKTTIGKPIKGVDIKILRKNNTLVDNMEIGRICVNCSWSINKKVYIETGDLGYKDESGYIYLRGRCDDMIISGGENVYPDEIESILLIHENILEAVVIGIDDKEFGQRLCAYIVVENNDIAASDILIWLKDKVARFQMPRELFIVDSIPTTLVGKYNKKALAKI